MVKKIIVDNKDYFQCEECFLNYKVKAWSEKCEDWCKKTNSCNISITNHAIKGEIKWQ